MRVSRANTAKYNNVLMIVLEKESVQDLLTSNVYVPRDSQDLTVLLLFANKIVT